jgi:hypothetical protein
MAPRTGSRHSFALGVPDELARRFLSEREPYRFTVATSATTRIDARGSDRCRRMITTSRSAWYIESVTKRRKMAASVPAASSLGSTAKAPMRAESQ